MDAIHSGEWPGKGVPDISWTCFRCRFTWTGGFHDFNNCCGILGKDVVLHHIDEICQKLCDTPPLESQGNSVLISMREVAEIILSPHGRAFRGLHGDSWDLSSIYHADPSCSCVYDKTTIQTDQGNLMTFPGSVHTVSGASEDNSTHG